MTRELKSSTVRRVLFPVDTPEDQAASQNYFNNVQESLDKELREKSQKWGFDFKEGVPLEGEYEWKTIKDENIGYDWIGRIKNNNVTEDIKDEDLKKANEETPKSFKDSELTIPKLRKRPLQDSDKLEDSNVRKKLVFE